MNKFFKQYPRAICEAENVLPSLLAWQRRGLRTAVVTLIGIEGSSPRPLGAQMAVAEDGHYAGYLSGGCFEAAVVSEALQAMESHTNRLVRYGKGSPYMDIKLPCGSGIDLYFDQNIPVDLIHQAHALLDARSPVSIDTDLSSGDKQLSRLDHTSSVECHRMLNAFRSIYMPCLRVVVAGHGPAFLAIAKLLSACGLIHYCVTRDGDAAMELAEHNIIAHRSLDDAVALDAYSAMVLCFHEHEHELPLLADALASDCFYIGALGGRRTSQQRRTLLSARGYGEQAINRIRAPIGLIADAKGQLSTVSSILAELVLEAKKKKIIS